MFVCLVGLGMYLHLVAGRLTENTVPCSSDYFSLNGKCGDADHAFMRCPKGYWCSQYGFCGTSLEYRHNAVCAREKRDDPDVGSVEYRFALDDKPEDFIPADDSEADVYDHDKSNHNCYSSKFHRWGKCGTPAHGNFRCRYGEWCNQFGFCGKYRNDPVNALCPREKRPNPAIIHYEPAPDDEVFFHSCNIHNRSSASNPQFTS